MTSVPNKTASRPLFRSATKHHDHKNGTMLTTAPHLVVRRPSPTTIEYTVTTSPVLTIPLRLLFYTTHILRVLIGLFLILTIYSRWTSSALFAHFAPGHLVASNALAMDPPPFFTNENIWYTIALVRTSAIGQIAQHLAQTLPVPLLATVSTFIAFLLLRRPHTTETLLVLRGLGVQVSSTPGTYLSKTSTRFIPTEKMQDIFVNEAFRGFEVRYYLVVVVKGEEEVVVVFPRLLPRRGIVEKVWRGSRGCLFEPVTNDARKVEG